MSSKLQFLPSLRLLCLMAMLALFGCGKHAPLKPAQASPSVQIKDTQLLRVQDAIAIVFRKFDEDSLYAGKQVVIESLAANERGGNWEVGVTGNINRTQRINTTYVIERKTGQIIATKIGQ